MARPREKTVADLEAVRAMIQGFRVTIASPVAALTLKASLPPGAARVIDQVLEVQDKIALSVLDLEERIQLLEYQLRQLVKGHEETLRVLS